MQERSQFRANMGEKSHIYIKVQNIIQFSEKKMSKHLLGHYYAGCAWNSGVTILSLSLSVCLSLGCRYLADVREEFCWFSLRPIMYVCDMRRESIKLERVCVHAHMCMWVCVITSCSVNSGLFCFGPIPPTPPLSSANQISHAKRQQELWAS